MASVTYDHVVKRFGDNTVIHDLNIEIDDKEFLVLVGPSGCGKSTALRMLAGLEEVSEGQILIGERVVNDIAPKDRDIAMVFQSYALYPHMTVFDNMAFGLKLRKMDKREIRDRVQRAAESLDIAHLLERKPKQLSGGQRQRVAVGRAIVRNPAVFLLDEPLSNLDAKLRVQTRAELTKLHQDLQTTFIYVTHDQVEAMTMASRIAVMNAGILQQVDTPQALYDQPANIFVAGFIGSPSMNFFDGQLVQSNSKLIVDTRSFHVEIPKEKTKQYGQHVGKQVILGIRPEHIHDTKYTPPGVKPALVEANVDVKELMGNEIVLYLVTGEHEYVARFDPRSTAHIGDQIQVAFNMQNMHLFDRETEAAIL